MTNDEMVERVADTIEQWAQPYAGALEAIREHSPVKEILIRLQEAVRNVESAEKLALAGTYEHDLYVKAALMSAWPTIKAYVHLETKTRAVILS